MGRWWCQTARMASRFLIPDRDQLFLEAVSYRGVLGEEHLVWTVIGVVDQLDLSELYARYEGDPVVGGRPAFDPAMMLELLVFGYCEGKRSSRALEEACRRDWAYRAICGGMVPDHATIARFRVQMDDLLADLFVQVLAVCAQVGLARVGVVAIDGTRMEAAASKEANRTASHLGALEAEARRMLAEAAQADAADEAAAGPTAARQVANQADRLERIRRAQQVVAEAMATKEAEEKKRGKAKRPVGNTTDPDSRLQKTRTGFIQGYNAQVAVSADQVVVAAEVTPDPTDVAMLGPMLQSVRQNLSAARVEAPIEVGLADAGYWSQDNAELEIEGVDMVLLIATTKTHKVGSGSDGLSADQIDTRNRLIARVHAGELGIGDAAEQLGLAPNYVSRLLGRWRQSGTVATTATAARHRMEAKLAENQDLYRQRGWLIEGSFAHTKTHRNTRRFQRRGRVACDAEWKLVNLAGNIRKIHRRITAPPPERCTPSANTSSTTRCRRPGDTRPAPPSARPHRMSWPHAYRHTRQHQPR